MARNVSLIGLAATVGACIVAAGARAGDSSSRSEGGKIVLVELFTSQG